jgi:phosphoglycerol transferase MdoB-like AlkP superfamily enzyme
MVYFRFTEKRLAFDIFKFAQTEGGFLRLIPGFFKDYWFLFLLFIVMIVLFVWGASQIISKKPSSPLVMKRWYIKNSGYALLTLMLMFVGVRGVNPRPIKLTTAGQYTQYRNEAFVLNTPFSVLTTMKSNSILPCYYFDDDTLKTIYTPIRQYNADSIFCQKNIIIIILESFSAEHSQYFTPELDKSYMPNLDKIAQQGRSLLCYANGKRSMEAIPAILSNTPTIMRTEYLSSAYSCNAITGLPSILKAYNYHSAFFHGGNNGTMHFDEYAKMAGFQHYFGAKEYNNHADYDGNWGIFDVPFLQYVIRQMDTMSLPFCNAIFTLSSHPPYTLPDDYRNLLSNPQQEIGIRESIQYADYALGKFMEEAQNHTWFDNTIFVFVADHTSQSFLPYSRLRHYEIPLIFYSPKGDLPNLQTSFAQQLDIMPSLLQLLHYSKPFFAFGNSVFEPHIPFAINFSNESYQFITDNKVFIFDGQKTIMMYDSNSHQPEDLLTKEAIPEKEDRLMRAIIQTYNNALIENRLTLKRYEK